MTQMVDPKVCSSQSETLRLWQAVCAVDRSDGSRAGGCTCTCAGQTDVQISQSARSRSDWGDISRHHSRMHGVRVMCDVCARGRARARGKRSRSDLGGIGRRYCQRTLPNAISCTMDATRRRDLRAQRSSSKKVRTINHAGVACR